MSVEILDEEFEDYEIPLTDEYSSFEKEHELIDIKPSEFTEFAFNIPVGGQLQKFSFEGRPYLQQIYNTASDRRLLMAGRQVEKSTLCGNQTLTYCCTIPYFTALYVSPSHTQTKEFSRKRIQDVIETSQFLKSFTNSKMTSNLLEKKFINFSQVKLRFAFLNADRARGISADYVLIDEFQDILLENVPVIEECASHSSYKLFTYAGTPKSLDNAIEYYWIKYSTQNEWVIPCRRHGTPKDPSSWHWNILDEHSIGLEGLICDKCGGLIHADDPDARWAAQNPSPKASRPFDGFRIPQLMVPWIEWSEILDKYTYYPRAQFYNEVLGRSYDSGTRPLTQQDIRDNCNEDLSMFSFQEIAKKYVGSVPIYMGIDWGTGEGESFTVITLGAYLPWAPDKFTIFYAKRCTGQEAEPKIQIQIIKQLIDMFKVSIVGADYGGGHWPNDELVRTYGGNRFMKYQWVGNVKTKIVYDDKLGSPRFLCHRTEIMSDMFNAIKRRDVFRFPKWSEWHEPFATDALNIFSEYNDKIKMNVYKRRPGAPDDTFHSMTFCFLASMINRPRPDVIFPKTRVHTAEGEAIPTLTRREELDVE